jgi:hypothetical protein
MNLAFGLVLLTLMALGWYFRADAVTRRRLKAVPSGTSADATDGALLRVTGVIQPGEAQLEAPFSGTACVWYRATADEHETNAESSYHRTIVTEEKGVDFVLRDAAGDVRVRMAGAKVASVPNAKLRSGTFHDATTTQEDFLRRNGQQSTGLLGLNRNLRYTERALEVGETITVLGRVRRERGSVVLEADGDNGILLSDDARVVG